MKQCYGHLDCVEISRIITIQIKAYIYSSICDSQTWILLVKYDSNFVSESKDKPCKNLGVTVGIGIIVDLILSSLCLKNSTITWNFLTPLVHCSYIFSAIILNEWSASTPSVNFNIYRLVFRMDILFTILM